MISNLNDQVRNNLIKYKTRSGIIKYLKSLPQTEMNHAICILVSDYYKTIVYDLKHNKNEEGIENLKLFFEPTINLNSEKVLKLLNAVNRFDGLIKIEKIKLMEELQEKTYDETLNVLNPYHMLDKLTYSFEYNIESIKSYYLDYVKQTKNYKNEENSVTAYISNKLYEICNKEKNKYDKIMLMALEDYYKWKLYLSGKNNYKETYKEKFYMRIIKDFSLDSILGLTRMDSEFRNTIISEYLYHSTICSKYDNYAATKNYFHKDESGVQKKLKKETK